MRAARWTVVVLLPLTLVLLWMPEPPGSVLTVYRAGPNVVEVSLREPLRPADFEALQARYEREGVERIRVYGYAPGTTPGSDPPTSHLKWDVFYYTWAVSYRTTQSQVTPPPPYWFQLLQAAEDARRRRRREG